jgi:class 3 adenylate cyclase/tetratricopeptide (TPR) repeat protein
MAAMMLANAELACYLPGIIRQRLNNINPDGRLEPAKETFPAAILSADLSGFTALTEYLTHTSPTGAEELTQILDLYFGHLVRIVTSHGGDVIKFAGDGLIALWYGAEDLALLTRRAVQCGLAIQMMMSPAIWSTEAIDVKARSLRVRVGIGAGDVTLMHLGGVFERWELLIVGDAVRDTGAAEAAAPPGEVVLTETAWRLVQPWCEAVQLSDGRWQLTALLDDVPLRAFATPAIDQSQIDFLRSYVPKAILSHIDAGQTAWLAEQRYVTVLFAHLGDLTAETPLPAAQAAIRALQTCLYRYEGSISRLGTDNKGPTLLAAFGLPPFAHEDDALRGVLTAHDIVNTLSNLGFSCTIGVASGMALCSSVGGQDRREYTMMGSVVNRAARLMQAAQQTDVAILCDSEIAAACRDRVSFSALPPLQLRGIADPVTVFQPIFDPANTLSVQRIHIDRDGEALIGRASELALLRDRLERLQRGQSGGVLILGEAGIGKSHLIQTFLAQARAHGTIVLHSTARFIERSPYSALRSGLPVLLNDGRLATLSDSIYSLAGELWPTNRGSQGLSAHTLPQIHTQRLHDGLIAVLSRVAEHAPLLVAIEDVQWLDDPTWTLLADLLDQDAPVLIILTGRPPLSITEERQRLLHHRLLDQIKLHGLSPPEIHDLLARYLDVKQVDEAIWRLIAEQTQGHPFFSIELVKALRDAGLLMRQQHICRFVPGAARRALHMVRLPSTVQGLITSRFDQLTLDQQLTLKVASVIGVEFDTATLQAIHPDHIPEEQLTAQLFAIQQSGLIALERSGPTIRYTFRPAAIAEAIYNLMSFAQRRQLHAQFANYLEQHYGHDPQRAMTIAHHWKAAGELIRARPYLDRAGELALHNGDYAGAIDLLEQAHQIGDDEPATTVGHRERLLAAAYYGQGRLTESYHFLQRAFTRFGLPLPTERRTLPWLILAELGRYLLTLLRLGRKKPSINDHLVELAQAANVLIQINFYQHDLLRTIHSLLFALNLAETAHIPAMKARAYACMELALNRFPPLARLYRRKTMRLTSVLNDPSTTAWVAQMQGLAALGRGEWRRAQAALEFGSSIAQQTGETRRWIECRAMLVMLQVRLGNVDAAITEIAEIVARGERSRDQQVQIGGHLSAVELYLAIGDTAAAITEWQTASNLFTDASRISRADQIWHTTLAARIALLRGETHQAHELAVQALQQIDSEPPLAIYLLRSYEALTTMPLSWRQRWMARFVRWQVGLVFPLAFWKEKRK